MIHIDAETYVRDVGNLASKIDASKYSGVYGIPTGGGMVALELSRHLGLPVAAKPTTGTLIADDLIDSGRTLQDYPGYDTAVIYRKPFSPHLETYCGREVDGWIVFFYDKEDFGLEDNVARILQYLDQDVASPELRDTPAKYLELLKNFLTPADIKLNITETSSKEPVVYEAIPFVSLCQCHMMPILGEISVEFVPNGYTVSREEVEKFIQNQTRKLVDSDSLQSEIQGLLQESIKTFGATVTVMCQKTCTELSC